MFREKSCATIVARSEISRRRKVAQNVVEHSGRVGVETGCGDRRHHVEERAVESTFG
jgi:hypothetical protein